MRKYILIIFLGFIALSCKSEQEKAMASANKELMLKMANEKFAKKKWRDALALYDRLTNLVAGTDDYPNVLYNQAYANYYDKVYRIAGSQFKSFSINFPKDSRAEEAAYMSALCYYQGSQEYNLDQTNTELAINELQNFLNDYPTSERGKNINQLVEELSYKIEFKAYENARQYYKMTDYKSAVVTFENVLADYPSTKLRPNILEYLLKSRYELAMNSIYDLKEERILNAIAYTKQIEREAPDTNLAKEAVDMREKLLAEQTKFQTVKKEVEARKAEIAAKQKISEAKLASEEKAQEEAKRRRKQEGQAKQMLLDSARRTTPPPAAIIPIK